MVLGVPMESANLKHMVKNVHTLLLIKTTIVVTDIATETTIPVTPTLKMEVLAMVQVVIFRVFQALVARLAKLASSMDL
jgi:hypothetical protein